MKTLKQKLQSILAQAGKVRVDVVLARVAVVTGAVAAIAPWTGYIPGKTGATIAGICAIAAGLTPRIQHAAGLLSPVYAGQTPFLKVVPELVKTLLSAPQLVAQEKADARAAEEAQQAAQAKVQAELARLKAEQDKAAMVEEVAAKVAGMLKTGSFPPGSLTDQIPAELASAFSDKSPTLSSVATISDKVNS